MDIVCQRSLSQRLEIRRAYQQQYQQDLLRLLASELSGDFGSLVASLFITPIELLAYQLYQSLKKSGSNRRTLTNILCCCDNTEIHLIKKAYMNRLREEGQDKDRSRCLESDVNKRTKGHYEVLLNSILKADRCGDSEEQSDLTHRPQFTNELVDHELVTTDVAELEGALENIPKPGNQCTKPKDPNCTLTLIKILTKRSKRHVRAIWDAYRKKHGINLIHAIAQKVSEPLRTALNTMIMTQVNLRLLLVCQLHEAMQGQGTDEDALTRIICLHAEHDLRDLVEDYEKYFGVSLKSVIHSDTSGDFRELLLQLIGN